MKLGELPEGWVRASVCDVGTVVTGNTPSTQTPSNYGGQIPFVKPPQLNDLPIGATREFLSEQGAQSARVLPPFSILVSCIGNLGKTGLSKTPVAFNQQINAIIPSGEISPVFLFYQAQSHDFRSQLEAKATATTISIVNKGNFETVKLNIAPLAEQNRIVAKIEELFSELDQGVASLKMAREQLKVYRQSLLKNAFAGKLTAAWRAAHADQLETAAAQQQRIARERTDRHRQQLADWQANGQPGPKPKPPKPLPPLTPEELAELPELPAGWGWVKLGALASQITDGEHFRPPTTEQGIPFLSAKDVRDEGVSFDAPLYIKLETAEKTWGRCRPERNDILIVSRGATVGRMCAVNTDRPFSLLGSVILVKGTSAALSAYLLSALKAPLANKKIVGASGATAQQAIYLRDIQSVPVAVCSLLEQTEIVQELESKLSEADHLDQTLATALQQAEALRQSILKKAFCGQLVKQDQNDEPASALLERIRAMQHLSVKRSSRNPSK